MKYIYVFLVMSAIFFSGCEFLADIEQSVCDSMEDGDHCYQDVAVRWDRPEVCSDIEKAGPQTKCIIRSVQKSGDIDLCSKMKFGSGAYDKAQCLMEAAIKNKNPSICEQMGSYSHSLGNDLSSYKPIDQEACYDKVYALCGKEKGSCCADMTCDVAMYCDGATHTCIRWSGDYGKKGEPCFTPKNGDRLTCTSYLRCSAQGICVEYDQCGGYNQACCHPDSYTICGYFNNQKLTCKNNLCQVY